MTRATSPFCNSGIQVTQWPSQMCQKMHVKRRLCGDPFTEIYTTSIQKFFNGKLPLPYPPGNPSHSYYSPPTPVFPHSSKFYPECTADVFHQKHLVRDYLSTMHPYSDPNDHGRTYNQSRLKSQGESREGRGGKQGALEDFIHDEPVRPRSTGYSKGHVRNMLGLDTFGEKSSEEIRAQRELGLLPQSPNTDRYKNAPLSPSSTTSTASSVSPPRRPNTTGMNSYPMDSADVYFPLPMNFQSTGQAGEGLAGAESFAVLETTNFGDEFARPDPSTANARGGKVKVVPGTIGYAGPAITREDIVLKDPHGKGVEYFNAIMTRKHTRAEKSLSKSKEARRLKELQHEAFQAATHIADFEANLFTILATQRPL